MKDNTFGQDFIEKLKQKNDIVSIISKSVRLEKKGRNFWGCCPFHHEKTPSFCINEYEQFYHCFGCGESGDVITFLRKYENMDYMEAIKYLADNAGMEIPSFENNDKYLKNKKIKDKSLEILNLAKDIYKQNIYKPQAKLAQDYIKKRKVTKKELEDFELGYSLDYFQIVNLLKAKGFSDEDLKSSGVCEIGKNGKAYDFLAERLVFPIVNSQGDCIGFSGRDLKNSGIMKYKNTSATLVFDKSKTIYAINLIKKLKQSEGLNEIIIVEGQFDVITMHRYGFRNTVACLGTAITSEHIRELKRFTDNIVLCLDGDSAGQKATIRAINTFADSDLNVKVAVLPDKKDPDEFLSEFGSEGLKNIIDNAIAPMNFKILMSKNKFDITKPNEKAQFIAEVLGEINKLKTSTEKDIYLNELNKTAGIPIDVLRRDLAGKGIDENPNVQEDNTKSIVLPEQDATSKAVKFVLACYLMDKPYVDYGFNLKNFLHNSTYVKLFDLLVEKHNQNSKLIVSTLFNNDDFDVENDKNLQDIINFNFDIIADEEKYFAECLWGVVENELKFKSFNLSKQYKIETDADKRKEILGQIQKIALQLKKKNLEEI